MTIARMLVRCYPAPLRERWGPDLEQEAVSAGWRSWPDLARGAVTMWLHPTIWPAPTSTVQRRRGAASAVAIAFGCWLLTYFAAERGNLLPDAVSHGWPLAVENALILFGMLLLSPLPRPHPRAIARASLQVGGALAGPVLLAGTVVTLVHSLDPVAVPAPIRAAVVTAWSMAITAGALQICRTVAVLDTTITTPPGIRRLRYGTATLAAALTLIGSTLIGSVVSTTSVQLIPILLGSIVIVGTGALMGMLRDVGHPTASDVA